jgi:hypothetical protein
MLHRLVRLFSLSLVAFVLCAFASAQTVTVTGSVDELNPTPGNAVFLTLMLDTTGGASWDVFEGVLTQVGGGNLGSKFSFLGASNRDVIGISRSDVADIRAFASGDTVVFSIALNSPTALTSTGIVVELELDAGTTLPLSFDLTTTGMVFGSGGDQPTITRGVVGFPITLGGGSTPTGTVAVNPDPDSINAPWTLTKPDASTQAGTGDQTLTDMALGSYSLAWGAVTDYDAPATPAAQTLIADGTITFAGTYTEVVAPATGTVVINADPDSINAPWTLTKPDASTQAGTGDETLTGMAVGSYSLAWGAVMGYDAPATPAPQTLAADGTITFAGTYTETPVPSPAVFVLDSYGAIHTGGTANAVTLTGGPYFGWDIARALEMVGGDVTTSGIGALLLDGYGAVHSYNSTRPDQWFYFETLGDIAADLAVFQSTSAGHAIGFYVLDRTGKLWDAGTAVGLIDTAAASVSPALDGTQVYAVDLLLADITGSSGWIMDSKGVVYPFGGAPDPGFPASAQNDWVDLEMVGSQLVRMDSSGTLGWSGTPTAGWDFPLVGGNLAIDFEVQATGLIMIDRYGAVYTSGTAVAPGAGEGPPYFGFEAVTEMEVLADPSSK